MSDIPSTMFIIHFTVENPWPLATMLLVLAIIVLFRGYMFTTMKVRLISSSIMLVLALIMVLAARFVETDAEEVNRLTREFVMSAVVGDAESVSNILHNNLKIYAGREITGLSKKGVLERIPALADFIKSNNLRDVQSGINSEGRGISVFEQTTITTMGYPTPNQWRCVWIQNENNNSENNKNNNNWQIIELYWEQMNFGDVPTASMLNLRN